MNKFLKENWFKICIFLSLLFLVSSFAYRYGIEQDNQGQISDTKIQEVEKPSLPNLILGHWRNDEAKLDYIFYQDQGYLSVIRENDSSECTYNIHKQNEEKNYLEVWFECPQPDWPGYAEDHTIEFSQNRDSFVDTMYIQGIARRIDGKFTFFGAMDTSSNNTNIEEADNWKTYSNDKYGIQFRYPNDYFDISTIDGIYAFNKYFSNINAEGDFSKIGLLDIQLGFSISKNEAIINNDERINNYKEIGLKISDIKSVTVDGIPAYQETEDAVGVKDLQDEEGCKLSTYFKKDGHSIQIEMFSPGGCETINKYRPIYDKIIGTIRFDQPVTVGAFPASHDDSAESNIKKYKVEAIQVGGIGSKIKQITTYEIDEIEHTTTPLLPPEEWGRVSFNSAGDIVDVDCKDGYYITTCKSDSGNEVVNDEDFGCRLMVEDKMQNRVQIECMDGN